ncbi:hypothetical protein [Marispirochaeta sp.]|uniref:hypothetical protein n=1 Tax=Marispirochaeta sp. TaxID=2038653 RepID=UPI0029C7C843|nr:hypothetical protein [Marispirochaeta sp.]
MILKDKLIRLSPPDTNEVLIKKIIVPVINNGKLKFIGKGKSTVDVQQIKERFNSLDIHLDWKLFTTIQKERNNIEHYYTSTGKDAIRRLIVLSFVLIRDFIKHELDESPIDYISKESWKGFWR